MEIMIHFHGYLITILNRIPSKKEKPIIETSDVTYKIVKCQDNRILKVKACRHPRRTEEQIDTKEDEENNDE